MFWNQCRNTAVNIRHFSKTVIKTYQNTIMAKCTASVNILMDVDVIEQTNGIITVRQLTSKIFNLVIVGFIV